MLWPQCLHDWIWYFGHGCRQRWRSLGMCDHRALWPHGCMSSSLVWVRRHGPSHPWTSPPGPLCDKPQPTATHSQTGKWQPSARDSCRSLRSAVKTERFPFYCTSEGEMIASALSVGDCAAEDMSCSCQSAGQTLYLCDPRPWNVRLLLPSAGLLAAWMTLPWPVNGETEMSSTFQLFFIILSVWSIWNIDAKMMGEIWYAIQWLNL